MRQNAQTSNDVEPSLKKSKQVSCPHFVVFDGRSLDGTPVDLAVVLWTMLSGSGLRRRA